MQRTLGLLTATFALLAAGCGGDDDNTDEEAATTATTEAAAEDVTVRLVAEEVGLGCTRTAPIGNGSQLVVLDASGTRLGVGTFELSPGLTEGVDTCDWTAVVEDIAADHDLYVLEGDGDELVTVDLAEEGWTVELYADLNGVEVR